MNPFLRQALRSTPSVLAIAVASPVVAQTYELPAPPMRTTIDERGVDLASGDVRISDPQLSIGTPQNGLSFERTWSGANGWRHNYMLAIRADKANHMLVMLGGAGVGFSLANGVYTSDLNDGSTLTENSGSFTYTAADGTTILFSKALVVNQTSYYGATSGMATTVTRPDGFKEYLAYKTSSYNVFVSGGVGNVTFYVSRLQSVRTSTGFQLKFTYGTDALGQSSVNQWMQVANVRAINNANDYCDPVADTCPSFTQAWSSVSYSRSGDTEAVTDPDGRVRRYVIGSNGKLSGVRRPTSPNSNSNTYAYDANGRVSSVAIADVGTWNYTFAANTTAGTLTASVKTASSIVPNPRVVVTGTASLRTLSDKDENGRTRTYEWCPAGTASCKPGLLTKASLPGGNYTTYAYDSRGNLTSTTAYPRPESGLGTLTTSATYPASCVNLATCNKPTSRTDAAGNVTNYYYRSDGLIDYVQLPAPAPGAPRPETRYAYWSGRAWYKINSNSVDLAPESDSVTWLLSTTTCITGSWPCATDKQRVMGLGYQGGPAATNMQIDSVMHQRGDGQQYTVTRFGSDPQGNITSVTDPLGQVTTVRYAADRQVTEVVTPSIDGTATGQKRSALMHYDGNAQMDSTSYGTVNSDGSNFQAIQRSLPLFDAAGRKVIERLTNGPMNTYYAVKQWSYDGAGRLECETVRMNPATFASPPSSACTLGAAGSDGPDRITRYVYEYAGLIDRVQTGYGTSAQRDEIRYARSSNDVLAAMIDAKGNITRYALDGHDRVLRECYNDPTEKCQAGTVSDFVQFNYDSAGRMVSRSLRGHPASVTIGYTYDNLGRTTFVNYPGDSPFDADVTYTYNNLGQLLTATDTNGRSATFGYDALGRVVSQGDATSIRTMQYDAAGRRTRLTWPDARYVTYGYNTVGEMTNIKESGSLNLATFAYDGMGRRTSLTRGNGVITNYDYDPASRLTCLRHNLTGGSTLNCNPTASGQDQATSFTYNASGQIKSRTAANDAYAWTNHYNLSRSYTANNLNQYTAAGPVTPTYDIKGNLTSAGEAANYAYSTKNELMWRGDVNINFHHDPLGRLASVTGGNYGFRYVDNQITDEYSTASGNPTLRRYVYGPGADEPIVVYEGVNFSNKRYNVADERGSVIAITDAAGNATAINKYDEYGIPGANNQGRFQYTGQAWIPELGMYSYKARIYSPYLGRFLQTDPAGYPDGPNWYNYTNNDPVNFIDPNGLSQTQWLFGREYRLACVNDECSWRATGNSMGSGTSGGAWGGSGGGGSGRPSPSPGPVGPASSPVSAPEPQKEKASDACNSVLNRLGNGLEGVGKGVSYSGLTIAGIGAFAGPEGALPGLFITEVGGVLSALGQVSQDVAFDRPFGEMAARAAFNAIGARVVNNVVPGSVRSGIGDAIFGQVIGEAASATNSSLDPDRCPK